MKSNKVLTTALLPALVMAGYLMPGFAQATTTTYVLSNHPNSGGSPPNPPGQTVTEFGLRLDGLLTGNAGEIYLFDFDDTASEMFLTYDDVAATITISGTALGYEIDEFNGGAIVGGTQALWDIDMTYSMVMEDIPDAGGFQDVEAGVTTTHMNSGTISTTDLGGLTFELRDHNAVDPDLTFAFGDDPLVSQGTGVLTGWGWLDYSSDGGTTWGGSDQNNPGEPFPYTADWLFEATVVPVPAAVWLFGSGLVGLIAVARRKKTATC